MPIHFDFEIPEHAAVLHVPLGDPGLPLVPAHLVLLHHPLRQQAVTLWEAN